MASFLDMYIPICQSKNYSFPSYIVSLFDKQIFLSETKNPRHLDCCLYPFSKINQDIPIVVGRENPFALCSQFLAHSRLGPFKCPNSLPSAARREGIRPFSPALGGIRQIGHPGNWLRVAQGFISPHYCLTEKRSVFGMMAD
jgi:hypothetical protein